MTGSFSEKRTRRPRVTEERAKAMIELLESGDSPAIVANKTGASTRQVLDIKYRLKWPELPRKIDYGHRRKCTRSNLTKASAERIWDAYYYKGLSAARLAKDEGMSENIVRQMLAQTTHVELTAHLKRNYPMNARSNRIDSPITAHERRADCITCNKDFTRGATRRKNCSKECATISMRRGLADARAALKQKNANG